MFSAEQWKVELGVDPNKRRCNVLLYKVVSVQLMKASQSEKSRWISRTTALLFPTLTNQWRIRAVARKYRDQIKNAKDDDQRKELLSDLHSETSEYREALEERRSTELIWKASQYNVDLNNIPVPEDEGELEPLKRYGHFIVGNLGHHYLHARSYDAIRREVIDAKQKHERYRREIWEFRIRVFTAIMIPLIGLLGAAIGLVAVLKKK